MDRTTAVKSDRYTSGFRWCQLRATYLQVSYIPSRTTVLSSRKQVQQQMLRKGCWGPHTRYYEWRS